MTPILEIRALFKNFGGFTAANDVNLSVQSGEIRCLIGPNGAGKSTLLSLIVGTLSPSGGEIFFDGREISGLKPHTRIKEGLGIKFQVPGIFTGLPTRQNLAISMLSRGYGSRLSDHVDEMLDLLDLTNEADTNAGELSHGKQQWLEIGMSVSTDPRLLLLDEPTAGMSLEETRKTGELVQKLNASGMAVIAIEHDMAFVRQIAGKVSVMHLGKIFCEGSMEEIERNEDVAEIYLGKF